VSAGTIDRDGYLVIAINKQRHPAHILAWVIGHGEWPEADLDHINAQKGDNRLVNLRKATVAQNGWNVGLIRRNTSGVKHVSWNAAAKKWQVKIRANGKDNYFGIHDDFDLACVIAHEARAALHGEFARGGTL